MVTRRSETAGSAFCMKGMEQTTSQMTAIHRDQKDDTVSLGGCGESQTDSEGPWCLHSRMLFSDQLAGSYRRQAVWCTCITSCLLFKFQKAIFLIHAWPVYRLLSIVYFGHQPPLPSRTSRSLPEYHTAHAA